MLTEYRNEPFTDWSDPTNVKRMEQALEHVRGQLGRFYPLVINGEEIRDREATPSLNPSRPSQTIGRVADATVEDVDSAMRAANDAFKGWSQTAPEVRARYLLNAAAIMRQRKYELCAWLVYEVSKSWVEADADVAELIDFAEYYAHQMIRLGGPQPVVPYPGEENELRYIGMGVCAVIPPWNFAGAIMGGMAMAALVAGNTVVLKPAHTASVIAAIFCRILNDELNLPPGVLNYVPGPGRMVGEAMVDHPLTRIIAFTGSREVGMRIFERAAKVHEGQIWLKRTVLEMGGKDSIIVDPSADLDAAAEAIVFSAFGFQGQKCSACSRAIIDEKVYDVLLEKIVERARRLTVGDPTDRNTFMGAVVDDKAYEKICDYIEIGKKEGRLVLGGEVSKRESEDEGYFIPPTIIADIDPMARISQEEIFGPVLAVIKSRDFDHSMEIVNNTMFGLTGAIFSRRREQIERARHEFHVGNLYINRKCTGALVGVQPFGGFNMSGTDSKAGGPDYLLLFTQAKSITERLLPSAIKQRPSGDM